MQTITKIKIQSFGAEQNTLTFNCSIQQGINLFNSLPIPREGYNQLIIIINGVQIACKTTEFGWHYGQSKVIDLLSYCDYQYQARA